MEEDRSRYDVVFSGEAVPGVSLDAVKQRLAAALKASPGSVDRLFSGGAVCLKKNITLDRAKRIQQQLRSLGAVAKVEAVAKSLDFTLEEIEPVRPTLSPVNPAPSRYSNEVKEYSAKPLADAHESVTNREDVSVALWERLSLQIVLFVLLFAVGIGFVAIFFPWPDGVWRRGFFVGLLLVLFSYRHIKSNI